MKFIIRQALLGLAALASLVAQAGPIEGFGKSNAADEAVRATPSGTFANLPLTFELNQGQTHESVKFLSRGPGYNLFLTSAETVLVVGTRKEQVRTSEDSLSIRKNLTEQLDRADAEPAYDTDVVRIRFIDAHSNPNIVGVGLLETKSNYFIGNDSAKWHTDVAHYAKVRIENIYPGVNKVYYGNQQQLEYDLEVLPGADPTQIKQEFIGAQWLNLDDNGDLIVHTEHGVIRQLKPLIYQHQGDGEFQFIAGGYLIDHQTQQVRFSVGDYDRSKLLVIDPVLSYGIVLSGSSVASWVSALAVDVTGNTYLAGMVAQPGFPVVNPFQATHRGNRDAFVSKLNPAGTALVYSTYLGGAQWNDEPSGIAVDTAGSAYLVGSTKSRDFPTRNPLQAQMFGDSAAFITKLNPSGNDLVYSTYLGGTGRSDNGSGRAIAVDAAGGAYVTGRAGSTNFPTTSGAYRSLGPGDSYVVKLAPDGRSLIYGTYLDGEARSIAINASGHAYITGYTQAGRAFDTHNPIQGTPGGVLDGDAFITKLNADGSALLFSTYFGGSRYDVGNSIAVDSAGNAYIAGATGSTEFPWSPSTVALFAPTPGDSTDAFLAKLSADGQTLAYFAYLGGRRCDGSSCVRADSYGLSVAVDGNRYAYIAGKTNASTFPLVNALPANLGYPSHSFVTKITPQGSGLAYSTFLDAEPRDAGSGSGFNSHAVAADSAGSNATVSFFSTIPLGVFVARINTTGNTVTTLTSSRNPAPLGQAVTLTVAVAGNNPTGNVEIKDSETTLATVALSGAIANYTTSSLSAGRRLLKARYLGDGNNPPSESAVLAQVVGLLPTQTQLRAPARAWDGQPVTLTATVASSEQTTTITGTVRFVDNGTVTLGESPVNYGQASLITTLPVGNRPISAVYSGNASYASSTSATVFVQVGPSAPPIVNITRPRQGDTLTWGRIDRAEATASTPDGGAGGGITRIGFEIGSEYGHITIPPPPPSITSAYAELYRGSGFYPPVGSLQLFATATNEAGLTARSTEVTVTILPPRPDLSYIIPRANARYAGATDIPLHASACFPPRAGPEARIERIEFYEGARLIGVSTVDRGRGDNCYHFDAVWLNASLGNYSLTIKAYDNFGQDWTSDPINISVINDNAITVTVTPEPPLVREAPVSIPISGQAASTGSAITRLEFVEHGFLLGSPTFTTSQPGLYVFRAQATDSRGISKVSSPVNVIVNPKGGGLPTVSIASPAEGASFPQGSTVDVSAIASSRGGQIRRLEFSYSRNGGSSITLCDINTADSIVYETCAFSSIPEGSYRWTVRATDDRSQSATSTPVNFTVYGPPTVSITAPAEGASFLQGSNVDIRAAAHSNSGQIRRLEFIYSRNGGSSTTLCDTNTAARTIIATCTFSNIPDGNYRWTVRATDDRNQSTTSDAINIVVNPSSGPPSVRLTSPTDGISFAAPATITLTAEASAAEGIRQVEFLNGAAVLATITASPYTYTWSDVPVGDYTLTARVTSNQSRFSTSGPVTVSVGVTALNVSTPNPDETIYFDRVIVAGTFAGEPPSSITVNGDPVTLGANTFAASVPLTMGPNTLTIIAVTGKGNVTRQLDVSRANLSVSVTSHSSGASVNTRKVFVFGTYQGPPNSTVLVKGVVAHLNGNNFYAHNVPLDPGSNTFPITIKAMDEITATQNFTLISTAAYPIEVEANPTYGIQQMQVVFTVRNNSGLPILRVEIDPSGGGSPQQVPGNATEFTVQYPAPGFSRPTLYVTVGEQLPGTRYQVQLAVKVQAVAEVDAMLRGVFTAMLNRLKAGDASWASATVNSCKVEKYQTVFTTMAKAADRGTDIDSLGNLVSGRASINFAEYLLRREDDGGPLGFLIYFVRGQDGIWRIDEM